MKVVVGVMGVNRIQNEVGKQADIRNHMRSINDLPQFKGKVLAIERVPAGLSSYQVMYFLMQCWKSRVMETGNAPAGTQWICTASEGK